MIREPKVDRMLPNAKGLSAAAKIVEITSKQTKQPAGGLLFGTVVSTSPLSINVDNRLTVGEGNLILSPFCIETKINLKHTHEAEASSKGSSDTEEAFTDEDKVKTTNDKEISLKHKHALPESSIEIKIEEAFKEPITLWEGLSAGDSVIMIGSNDSQLYYVLQKAGGIK